MERYPSRPPDRLDQTDIIIDLHVAGLHPWLRLADAMKVHRDETKGVLQCLGEGSPLPSGAWGAVNQHDRLARAELGVLYSDATCRESRHVGSSSIPSTP